MRTRAILVGLLFVMSAPAIACPVQPATAAAEAAVRSINLLADFATTACAPAASGALCDMVCVSQQRITDRHRAWVAIVVAGAAVQMRRSGAARWANVSWADRGQLERREYRSLPAARAIALQLDVSSDRITLDQFIARIESEARSVPIRGR